MLVLHVLSESDNYGYEIVKKINEDSNKVIDIKEGVLYPILYKLLEEGYIFRYYKFINNRKRVYYSITGKGQKELEIMKTEYRNIVSGINNIMRE